MTDRTNNLIRVNLKFFTILTITLISINLIVIGFLRSHPVYHNPVNSPNILLEGWIVKRLINEAPEYLTAKDVESIVIIRMKNSEKRISFQDNDQKQILNNNSNKFTLASNGILAFAIPGEGFNECTTLSLKIRGSRDSSYSAHCAVFFNNSLLHHGFAKEKFTEYNFTINAGNMDSINYLIICFDNDACTSGGDRNLYVASVCIDKKAIGEVAEDMFILNEAHKGTLELLHEQKLQLLLLSDIGCDTTKIKIVTINNVSLNKSIAYARGAQSYFIRSNIASLNLITEEMHSRRSYLNFRASLNEGIELGCIALPMESKNSLFAELDERLSLMFSRVYWILN